MENNRFMNVKIRKRNEIEGISLFHYVSYGSNPEREVLRNLIFKFKGTDSSNEFFREYLAEKISSYLPLIFNCKKEDLVILCVPASKKVTHEIRYKGFCEKLRSMGVKADYETLYLNEDVRTKHTSYFGGISSGTAKTFAECLRVKRGNLGNLRGKKVVIFDDVITHGNNIGNCYDLLKSNGIDSKFLTIGRTYNETYETRGTSATIYEYGGGTEGLMKSLKEFKNPLRETVI